jgi:hypothetical protein
MNLASKEKDGGDQENHGTTQRSKEQKADDKTRDKNHCTKDVDRQENAEPGPTGRGGDPPTFGFRWRKIAEDIHDDLERKASNMSAQPDEPDHGWKGRESRSGRGQRVTNKHPETEIERGREDTQVRQSLRMSPSRKEV